MRARRNVCGGGGRLSTAAVRSRLRPPSCTDDLHGVQVQAGRSATDGLEIPADGAVADSGGGRWAVVVVGGDGCGRWQTVGGGGR